MRYFKKEIITNKIRFQDSYVQFEPVGGTTGVTALDEGQHEALIVELDRLAEKRKMGVVRLSAEQYEALKKNGVRVHQPPSLQNQIRTVEPPVLLKESSVPSKAPAVPVGEPLPKTNQPRTITASPELAELLREQGQPLPPPVKLPPPGQSPAKSEAPAQSAKPLPKPKERAKRANRAVVTPPEPAVPPSE